MQVGRRERKLGQRGGEEGFARQCHVEGEGSGRRGRCRPAAGLPEGAGTGGRAPGAGQRKGRAFRACPGTSSWPWPWWTSRNGPPPPDPGPGGTRARFWGPTCGSGRRLPRSLCCRSACPSPRCGSSSTPPSRRPPLSSSGASRELSRSSCRGGTAPSPRGLRGQVQALTVCESSPSQLNYEHVDIPDITVWMHQFAYKTQRGAQRSNSKLDARLTSLLLKLEARRSS